MLRWLKRLAPQTLTMPSDLWCLSRSSALRRLHSSQFSPQVCTHLIFRPGHRWTIACKENNDNPSGCVTVVERLWKYQMHMRFLQKPVVKPVDTLWPTWYDMIISGFVLPLLICFMCRECFCSCSLIIGSAQRKILPHFQPHLPPVIKKKSWSRTFKDLLHNSIA